MSVRRLQLFVLLVSIIASVLATAPAALAAPPSNDNFAAAQVISGSSGSVSGSNIDATGEAGEPGNAGNSVPLQSVWFAWVAPESRSFRFDTCNGGFDSTLGVYTGTAVNALSQVAANDDFCGPSDVSSMVTISATAGATYYVSIDGWGPKTAPFTLSWGYLNDAFAHAQPISGPIGTTRGTNAGFTSEPDEPDNADASAPIQSAWYSWTAPRTGRVTFDTCSSKSDPDTTLGAYTGSSVGGLILVVQDNNGCGEWSQTSRVSFDAQTGTTYRISVDSDNDATVTFTLAWQYPNDDFADAEVLTGSNGSVHGRNTNFTEEWGEPNNAGDSHPINSAWFAWTAPQDGQFSFDTCVETYFDTTLGVYTGSRVEELTLEDENNDVACGWDRDLSRVSFTAVEGTTYRISVDSVDAEGGAFTLSWGPTPPTADLSVQKTDSADPVAVGSDVTYTIVVSNAGPDAATNVLVRDWMDETTTFVSYTATQGTCETPAYGDARLIECAVGAIPNGESETITVTVTTTETGNIFNATAVSANEPDYTVDDRWSSENTDVLNSPLADLSVTNSDSPDPVPLDSSVTYTMVVTNNGPGEAKEVVLENRFGEAWMSYESSTPPAETTCVEAEAEAWATRAVRCELGTIPAGETATVSVTLATLRSGNPSTWARVDTQSGDPDESNNSDTEHTVVNPINLIRNPSFETDSNRDGRPDSWSSNSHFTRQKMVVFAGKFAGRHRGTDKKSYVVQQTVSNIEGETGYQFSGRVKLPVAATSQFGIEIWWKSSSGTTLRKDTVPMYNDPDTGWYLASEYPDSPAGATKAQIRMVVKKLNATIYVDDFVLSR